MQVLKGNKKTNILFYLFILLFLSTINFFNIDKIDNSIFFKIKKIELHGLKKIDKNEILADLNYLYGKNIFFFKNTNVENILKQKNLIKEYEVTKIYPNKIRFKIKEANFVGLVIKNKKKYFLADNKKLILFDEKFNSNQLPQIYGIGAENYYQIFYEKLKKNNFDLKLIKNYYFYQINRWDLILNNNLIIKFPTKNLDEAILLVNELINQKKFNDKKVIDLRINRRIIVK